MKTKREEFVKRVEEIQREYDDLKVIMAVEDKSGYFHYTYPAMPLVEGLCLLSGIASQILSKSFQYNPEKYFNDRFDILTETLLTIDKRVQMIWKKEGILKREKDNENE